MNEQKNIVCYLCDYCHSERACLPEELLGYHRQQMLLQSLRGEHGKAVQKAAIKAFKKSLNEVIDQH